MNLEEIIGDMLRRIAELERRADGMIKRGRITEVDPARGMVRVRLNEEGAETAFLSAWVPYSQIAGALKAHTPPSVGQQMVIFSETGDYRQGMAVPMTWSDQEKSPSNKGDEHVVTFGQMRFELRAGELLAKAGSVTMRIHTGGVEFKEGRLEHDGRNIGKDHKHHDVTPGPALTGPPATS